MRECMRAAAVLAAAGLAGIASGQIATINGTGSVAGNGNSGFGDPIGSGSLGIETLADGTVNISVTTGTGFFNDTLVLYIDSVAGGLSNTSGMNSTGSVSEASISGNGFGGEFNNLGFAAGFGADFALNFEANDGFDSNFSGLVEIASGALNFQSTDGANTVGGAGSFNYSTDLPNPGAGDNTEDGRTSSPGSVLTASFNLADIGLSAGDSFKIVGTYLNPTNAFRSGEFFGVAQNSGFAADANIGNNTFGTGDFQLADNDFILVNSIPSPAGAAALGLAGLVGLRRRR